MPNSPTLIEGSDIDSCTKAQAVYEVALQINDAALAVYRDAERAYQTDPTDVFYHALSLAAYDAYDAANGAYLTSRAAYESLVDAQVRSDVAGRTE
jgi:hypothetical protein